MLTECRQALRIKTEAYDGELCSLMDAGARDLKLAGVLLPGIVSFQLVNDENGSHYEDNSDLQDALVMRAIFTYVRVHFGSPDDYERLQESYETQKTQLMHASEYTDYEESGDC